MAYYDSQNNQGKDINQILHEKHKEINEKYLERQKEKALRAWIKEEIARQLPEALEKAIKKYLK